MKKSIVVLIAIIIIAAGIGVYYSSSSPKVPERNVLTSDEIEDAVMNVRETDKSGKDVEYIKKGDKYVSVSDSKMTREIIKIAKGDINKDGEEDAVEVVAHCGASCGTVLTLIINDDGNAKVLQPNITPYPRLGGFKTNATDVSISSNILSVTFTNIENSTETLRYVLEDNMLIPA